MKSGTSKYSHQSDPRWRDLYRIGAVATIAFLVMTMLAVASYFIWSYAPGTMSVQEIFSLLQVDRLGGLISLELTVVVMLPIMVPQLLALYAALRQANESYALIALVFGLMGVGLWLTARPLVEMASLSALYAAAVDETIRSSILAAGEAVNAQFNGTSWLLAQILIGFSYTISCLLMLRSPMFRKSTAYVGLALSIFGYGFWIPVVGVILSLTGTIAGIAWYVLLARDFLRMGWSEPTALPLVTDATHPG